MTQLLEPLSKSNYYSREYSLDNFSPAEMAILERINEQVLTEHSLESVMECLFEKIRTVSPCDRISISFLEEDGMYLTSYSTQANYARFQLEPGYSEDIHLGSLWQVIQEGTPRIIDDLEEYGRAHPESKSTQLILAEGIRSSITCPLTMDGRNVGVIFYASKRAGVFGDHHVQMHTAIADRLSRTIDKFYRIGQLERSKAAYQEMLSFVSHELKSPLVSIMSIAGLLSDGFLGPMPPQQTAEIGKILERSDYMMSLIREYLELARFDEQDFRVQTRANVHFSRDILVPTLEMLQPQISAKEMRVTKPAETEADYMTCDPDLLKVVLMNLIGNAVKYGSSYGEIRIGCEEDDDRWTVSVENDGPGFPESSIPQLFRKFSRLKIPELHRESGTGIGLYNAWRIIAHHGGKIWAESKQGEWARFSFSVPKAVS